VVVLAQAQVPFALDTTFRLSAERRYVSSILPLPDGNVIASGRMRFPGELYDMFLVRLLPDGTRDGSFNNSGMGGGKLTPWQDRFYVDANGVVRRILLSGFQDPTFIGMGTGPYFTPLQGGDYHVFPDGRVVMSGAHTLSDTTRGFTGLHQFIWFTNTGYLDTTRIHRKANGNLSRFMELPPGSGLGQAGKFIISGHASEFDGRPVSRVFRIHADGSLDTTFNTGVDWGQARAYLPLDNGRIIAGGYMRLQGSSDTLRLVRFLPDGSLDPAFNAPQFGMGSLPSAGTSGPLILGLDPWGEGHLVVTGKFQTVDGHPRRGICLLDSNGTLLQAFDNNGVWPYMVQSQTYASLQGLIPYDQDHYLVWGAYHGYSDGETEDMGQRMISRLIAGELNTDPVSTTGFGVEQGRTGWFHLYPNPTRDLVTLDYTLPETAVQGYVRLRDLAGRELEVHTLNGNEGRLVLDTKAFAPGLYVVEVHSPTRLEYVQTLVVQ
jgi:uncharacterized delta-60 repeat protein